MTDSKNLLKKFNWKINGRFLGFGTSPEADWKIIFISTIFLALIVVCWCTYIFIRVEKGEIFVTSKPAETKSEIIDATKLRNAIIYYDNKVSEFQKIQKSGTASTTDPSL